MWKLQDKAECDVEELTQFGLTETGRKRILNRYGAFEEDENQVKDQENQNEFLDEQQEALMRERYFNNMRNSNVAENSLISFLKIIGRIKVDSKIIKYNSNKKLKKSIPGFHVNLGFGLHAGWAIEGAIGSHFKIDVTYLSPHVNMSARLEGLTKTYGVPLLFTNSLFNLFTTKK